MAQNIDPKSIITAEQEQMVLNHSGAYLTSQAFREALDYVAKHDKVAYAKLILMEYEERKSNDWQ